MFPKPTPTLPAVPKPIASTSESGRLEKRAAEACSNIVRDRAVSRCEFCGQRGIEAAHGFAKGPHPSVRFDGRNLFWSCRECHGRGHREPAWWTDQLVAILGRGRYEELAADAVKTGTQPDPADVIAVARKGRFLVERAA